MIKQIERYYLTGVLKRDNQEKKQYEQIYEDFQRIGEDLKRL
jgi:hypothetical protein